MKIRVYYAFDIDAEDNASAMKMVDAFLPDNPEEISYFGVGAKRVPSKESCGDCPFLDEWGCSYCVGDWLACFKNHDLPRSIIE